MANYYVATTGNNSNPGTIGSPFLTIAKGISVLVAGDTLYIRSGNYNESINSNNQTIPAGTSWSNVVTISAYPGESVTIYIVLLANSSIKYLVFKDLIIDGRRTSNETVYISTANHIRFTGCELKDSYFQGVLMPHPGSDYNEFINCNIHGHGHTVNLDHGIYCASRYNLIQGCDIHDNAAYGVTVYNGYGERPDGNVIKGNRFHHNAVLGSGGGIGVASSTGTLVYNNLVYSNRIGIEVAWGSPVGAKIYNNTVYGNVTGITMNSDSSGALVKNNIVYQSGSITNNGSGTVQANNLVGSGSTNNPQFVNAGSANFALQAGSPAIDHGTTLSEVTTDFAGVSRPQGTAYDIGAYEFVGGGGTPDTTPPTGMVVSPASGGTVSGTVTVTCSASDNIGVANVQFYLDGSPLGGPIT